MAASIFNYKERDFLNRDVFQPYVDLDGKAAAEFLIANGVENVTHADLGTNGLAKGTADGRTVELSTNGFLHIR